MVVEQGWQGARECSLRLHAKGWTVTYVIKGWLRAPLRELITLSDSMRLVTLPRPLFWAGVWVMLVCEWVRGRCRVLVVDRDRTRQASERWCRWAGIETVVLRETARGVELYRAHQPASLEAVFGCADRDACGVNL